jgi:hypothetical protein
LSSRWPVSTKKAVPNKALCDDYFNYFFLPGTQNHPHIQNSSTDHNQYYKQHGKLAGLIVRGWINGLTFPRDLPIQFDLTHTRRRWRIIFSPLPPTLLFPIILSYSRTICTI